MRNIALTGAKDEQVWQYAAEHGFLLASKDTDFYERSLVYGAPPKVVWLKTGNCTVSETIALLRNRYVLIRRFSEDDTASFLVLK